MRIYLIGYMGAGKTTFGKKFAEYAGLNFIDMDDYIEGRNRKSISDIFAEDGEDEFRKKERKALEELLEVQNIVIATGGGAPCFFDNMKLMNETGETVFIDIGAGVLVERLLESNAERPLIKEKTKSQLIEYINKSLTQRKEFYSKAKYRITDINIDLKEFANMLK